LVSLKNKFLLFYFFRYNNKGAKKNKITMKKIIYFFITPSLFFAILIGTLQIGSVAQAKQAVNTAHKKTTTSKISATKVVWTAGALKELRKVPRFVRPTVKAKITNYAKSHHIKTITAAIYKSIRV
jgi:hypothetical protein